MNNTKESFQKLGNKQNSINEDEDASYDLEIAVKRGIMTTLLFFSLYHYQKYMKSKQKKHTLYSFLLFLIFMISVNYSIMKFTPEFSKHMISGIGWGIGAVLINKILEL